VEIPGLTKSDYLRLKYLTQQLKESGHDVSATELAKAIGPSGEVTPALLKLVNPSPTDRDQAVSNVRKWEKDADKYVKNRCVHDCD
jgi:hypothetical protein